jgi:hypothetical protein
MRGVAAIVLVWGLVNLVLASLLFVFGSAVDDLSFATAYGMAGAVVAVGLLLLVRARPVGTRLLPALSYPAALLGVSLAALLLSTEFSFWLTLIASGLIVLALGGLLREARAMRKARDQTRSAS